MNICTNCKHFTFYMDRFECHHSKAIIDISPITGISNYHSAKHMRNSVKCDEEGKLYKPNLVTRILKFLHIE